MDNILIQLLECTLTVCMAQGVYLAELTGTNSFNWLTYTSLSHELSYVHSKWSVLIKSAKNTLWLR